MKRSTRAGDAMKENQNINIQLASICTIGASTVLVGVCTALAIAGASYLIAGLGMVEDPELIRGLGPAIGIIVGVGVAIYWAFAGPRFTSFFAKHGPAIAVAIGSFVGLWARLRRSVVVRTIIVLLLAMGALSASQAWISGAFMGTAIVEAWAVYKLLRSRRAES